MASERISEQLGEFLSSFFQIDGPPPPELGPYAEKIISFGNLFSHSPVAILMTDYHTHQFRYVSPNALQLSGYEAEVFMKEGLALLFKIQHPEDSKTFINEVSPAIFHHLGKMEPAQVLEAQIRFNYRIKRKDGKYIHVQQQNILLEATENGIPILDMAQCSVRGEASAEAPTMMRLQILTPDEKGVYQPIHTETYPKRPESEALTPRQTQILEFIAKGKDSRYIAEELNISLHTVNTHRRHMLKNMKVQSMPELVNMATVLGWI